MNKINVNLNTEKTRGIHELLNRTYFKQCSLAQQGVMDSEQSIECLTSQIERQVVQGLRVLMDSDDCPAKLGGVERGACSKKCLFETFVAYVYRQAAKVC